MGIPVLEGRAFDEGDRRDAQGVVLVNEALARRYWGDTSPLGRAVLASGALDTAIVVGVVGNLRHNGITGEVKGRYYVPHAQVNESMAGTMRGMTLTVGTQGDPRRLIEAVSAEVSALDPSMPVSQVRTLDEVLSSSLAQPRFGMVLLAAFAGLALGLAMVGIYGVIAYSVSQRTGEIGVRLALGAQAGQVVALVVRQGFVAALAGAAAGTLAAVYLSELLAGLLYGVTAQDPITFATVPALLLAVALIACWLPAARATRVRPASALRHE
jgi:putative ABC transport system permease protein